MFATLLGRLPRPPLAAIADAGSQVEAAVRIQEASGLEPITDGGLPAADTPTRTLAAAWTATQRLTDRIVKQAVPGPYGVGRSVAGGIEARTRATLAEAVRLNGLLRDLASAGCPLIEVHETAAVDIGADPAERALFREAHLRLLDGIDGPHWSLAVTGGRADEAGVATLLAAPYASLALDLIAGPDNWRLVVDTPGDRGIVCGALSAAEGSDDGPEVLLWAAGYAASTSRRGPDRVGLGTASSLAHLPWEVAVTKMRRLGEAARLVVAPAADRAQALDPRAVSSRSAALGRVESPPRRRRA